MWYRVVSCAEVRGGSGNSALSRFFKLLTRNEKFSNSFQIFEGMSVFFFYF